MASSSAGSSNLDLPISGVGANRAGSQSSSPLTGSYAGSLGSNGIGNNGAAAANNYTTTSSPLPAGHQQDLNYLYEQIQELSKFLQANRAKTAELTQMAQVAQRTNISSNNSNGATGASQEETKDQEGAVQSDKARIRELERELSKSNVLVEAYKHEQRENTNLIAMYEDAVGTMTEQIRNYCGNVEGRFLEQRRIYNNLLQAEKDDHLASRLEKDHWFAHYLEVREMIRTATRLRVDEWGEEYAVVAGLQGQVRCLRRILEWEVEEPEEEIGWPYLKDLPLED